MDVTGSLRLRRSAAPALDPAAQDQRQDRFTFGDYLDTANIVRRPDAINAQNAAAPEVTDISAAGPLDFAEFVANLNADRAAALLADDSDTSMFVPPLPEVEDPDPTAYMPAAAIANQAAKGLMGMAEYIKNQQDTEQAGQNRPTEDVEEAVRNTNTFLEMQQRTMRFRIDGDSGDLQVQVFNAQTEKIIREIPSSEALRFSARMREFFGTTGGMIDLAV